MIKRNFSNIDFSSFVNDITLKSILEEYALKQEALVSASKSNRKGINRHDPVLKYRKLFCKKSPLADIPCNEYINSTEFSLAVSRFIDSKEIRPLKYIWYVAPSSERPEITRYGILFNRNRFEPLTFNNSSDIDLFVNSFDGNILSDNYSGYDFWRVNTETVKNEWRLCSTVADNKSAYNVKKLVCTNGDIPLDSIMLFKYCKRDSYKNDTYTQLTPVSKVNDLIDFILRRAA